MHIAWYGSGHVLVVYSYSPYEHPLFPLIECNLFATNIFELLEYSRAMRFLSAKKDADFMQILSKVKPRTVFCLQKMIYFKETRWNKEFGCKENKKIICLNQISCMNPKYLFQSLELKNNALILRCKFGHEHSQPSTRHRVSKKSFIHYENDNNYLEKHHD